MRVVFTEIAGESYDRIIEFLLTNWTEKEVQTFINDTENLVSELKKGKILQYQKAEFNTRSALIGKKHIRVFFVQKSKDLINVLLFFDMREDPKKIPILLGFK